MSFLLDTDTVSAHLKSGALMHRLVQHAGRLHVSTVTLAELYAWALRANAPPHRLQGLLDLVNDVVVLDVTPEVARKFGEVQAQLLDHGHRAPQMDLLIGATGLIHGLTLVTRNQRHFAKMPGLSLDDWIVP
jgi:predicted nucleic acid-binding protein